MNIVFYGAVREVTGSMHLLAHKSDRILLDCGMFQGRRKESEEKNRVLPFDPRIITNILLSHAHIDHSGRIPLLTDSGFQGRIICTRASADASQYLLTDSAKIQESDADYLNYKTVRSFFYKLKTSPRTKQVSNRQKRNIKKLLKREGNELNREAINELIAEHNLEMVRPLYGVEQAERSLAYFDGYPYRNTVTIGQNMNCTLYDAGHILGSAISIIKTNENGRSCAIGYTGDLGRFNKPIIKDPTLEFAEEDRDLDLLIMESTYGDRFHDPVRDLKPHLRKALVDTYNRGGSMLIPSFAFGRTQELLYVLHELYNENNVPPMPIYVDSPLASRLTKVFGEHPEVYDEKTHETFLENGMNPFSFEQVSFIQSVDESMALMREEKPHIVLSASGMCEGGRILHHLRYKIHNERNTILIVGYMAQNTLGRRILEKAREYEESGRRGQPPMIRFLNKSYPLRAHVVELGGFSAHADRNELVRFLEESNLRIKKIAIVHGEEDQSLALAKLLQEKNFDAHVPRVGEMMWV